MKKSTTWVLVFSVLLCCFTGYVYADDTLNTEPLPTPEPQEPSVPKLLYYYYDESTQAQASTEDAQVFATHISQADTIEVTIQLNYSPPECTCFTALSMNATNEEVRAARIVHNNHSKRFHTAINQQLVDDARFSSNSPDYELIMSTYSPFVQLLFHEYSDFERNLQHITPLSIDSRIALVSICTQSNSDDSNEQQAVISPQQGSYPIIDAIDDINASNQTYTGEGIRVGILEAYGITSAFSHSDLSHLTIYSSSFSPFDDHAEDVTRVLCGAHGVAPDVDSVYIYKLTQSSLIEGLEWLIGHNVDLINISACQNEASEYNTNSRIIDYYISYYSLTIVTAAGNSGNSSNTPGRIAYMADFAMANNTIAVGALNSDNTVANYSSYYVPNIYPVRKPTISAPGTRIQIGNDILNSGTSISAPMVAGVIAKLMEEFPILICHPELVMAALVISASPVNGQTSIWDLHSGAGRIDYEKAREALSNYTLFLGTQNGPGLCTSQQISVDPNRTIKATFIWLENIFVSDDFGLEDFDPNNHAVLIYGHTNYDLVATDINGNELAASRTLYNIEILSYQNTSHESINLQIVQSQYKHVYETDKGALIWVYE